ncbi:MAG: PEGA domain-containing protein [Parvularculaceae bacterium]
MKRIVILAALALTAACKTFDLGSGQKITAIVSEPAGAYVNVEGLGECETPCRVALDGPRMVTVAKAGFKPQRFQATPEKRRIKVVLELVAPTEEVEAKELPKL